MKKKNLMICMSPDAIDKAKSLMYGFNRSMSGLIEWLIMKQELPINIGGPIFNVRDFAAPKDTHDLDDLKKATQKAINACVKAGGGTVVIPGQSDFGEKDEFWKLKDDLIRCYEEYINIESEYIEALKKGKDYAEINKLDIAYDTIDILRAKILKLRSRLN
jgi:hypothetical protein